MVRVGSLALGIVLAGLAAASASAEIYRWTDERGRLHFTERLDKVPLRYRAVAELEARRVRPDRLQHFSSALEADPADPAPARSYAVRRGGEIQIPFKREGSLMRVEVRLNDSITAPFYIDSGASGVSLPSRYAERLGLRVGRDTPHVQVTTAAGVVARPVVRLASVELAGARVEGLNATINPAMDVGLLGGTFFNNFVYSVDAAAGVITLAPNDQMRGGMGPDEWRDRFAHAHDLIHRLEVYMAENNLRRGERAELERRHEELRSALRTLQERADRLDVPYAWRR